MCCPGCFADPWLTNYIERESISIGNCIYCGRTDSQLIDPSKLAPYFEFVADAYSLKKSGETLAQLWSKHWKVFGPEANGQKIIDAVLGVGVGSATFSPRAVNGALSRELWSKFRSELQDQNRFFPANAPDRSGFGGIIEPLALTSKARMPSVFYRARIMTGESAYQLSEMGAPPANLATGGRANPPGIPYLYLADDVLTAVSEVKPGTGAFACVAEFRASSPEDLRIVDLTDPVSTISPFEAAAGDGLGIAELLSSMSFLEALGEELSIPTQPHRASRDYLASQYLCELIKVTGYDGVVYKSSVGPGRNYAFFRPGHFRAVSVSQYCVDAVEVKVSEV